jgi:hypothetical protein
VYKWFSRNPDIKTTVEDLTALIKFAFNSFVTKNVVFKAIKSYMNSINNYSVANERVMIEPTGRDGGGYCYYYWLERSF